MNKLFISFFLLIFVCAFAVRIQASGKKDQPVEIKLSGEILGKTHPTVEVVVNGKTRTFYLDTGGGISGISPALAKEIGCAPAGEMTGFDAGGRLAKIKRCENVSMDLSGFTVTKDVGVFEPMDYFPDAKKQLDGSIALDTFDQRIVTLDLKGERLWVESGKSFKKRIDGMKPVQSRLSREIGGATLDIFVAVSSPNGKMWFLLDTGNTNKLCIAPSAQRQLGIDFNGADGKKIIKPVKIDIIGLGAIEAEARNRDMIYDGMLSYDIISRMLWTINLQTGEAWTKLY
jgi:predicted aspartyl protease